MADRCLLYYITDRTQFPGDEVRRRSALLAKIAEAAIAGVDYIQVREKDLSARELEALASEAVSVIRENSKRKTASEKPGTRLLINSRADIAVAAGADGVHLRGDDVTPFDIRSVWAQALAHSPRVTTGSPLIAVSCHSPSEVLRAESEGADFAVFAPVFEKRSASPAGLSALHEACRAKIPVLALGGVTIQNAAACLEVGAAGIAAIRLFQINEIEEAVRPLRGREDTSWKNFATWRVPRD